MKNLFSLIVGGAVGFAAAYFLVSKPAENCKPAAAVAPASVQPVAPAVTPADDLQKLSVLNPTSAKNPARVIRQIVHYMESLVDAGNKAVVPISEVIGAGKDLDYLLDERAGAASSLPFWNWREGQPIVSGLVLPPSFRLGLVDVLKSIGTEEAQNVMAMMMNNTSRAVEVAYIAQVLEKLSPGVYSEIAMAAARRLLAAPPKAGSSSPLDANGNAYLYAMLNAHGDTSLVATAQSNLVSNARLDVDAANYLLTALKEKALPQLATTYQGANSEDKNRIAMMTFNYVGSSAEANQIFKDWILNSGQDANSQTVVARPRSLYLQMLCGGNFGPYHAEVPTNRDLINSRIGLLKEMDTASTDARLKQAIGQSLQCLQAR